MLMYKNVMQLYVVDHWWTTAICNKRPRWLVGNAALYKRDWGQVLSKYVSVLLYIFSYQPPSVIFIIL